MTTEEIAKCKVGDEVEYTAVGADQWYQRYKGQVGTIIQLRKWPYEGPRIRINKECIGTAWKRLKYIGKKQRQLTFVFSE